MAAAEARRLQLRAQAVMLRLLGELAATPVKRMSFELRSLRAEEVAAVAAAPNVTRFKRPARRR